jgi:hypothetical protein
MAPSLSLSRITNALNYIVKGVLRYIVSLISYHELNVHEITFSTTASYPLMYRDGCLDPIHR